MKETNLKSYMLYDFIYTTFWERQNRGDREDQWLLGVVGKVRDTWIGGAQETQDSETILYDTLMVDSWHYAFGKTIKEWILM